MKVGPQRHPQVVMNVREHIHFVDQQERSRHFQSQKSYKISKMITFEGFSRTAPSSGHFCYVLDKSPYLLKVSDFDKKYWFSKRKSSIKRMEHRAGTRKSLEMSARTFVDQQKRTRQVWGQKSSKKTAFSDFALNLVYQLEHIISLGQQSRATSGQQIPKREKKKMLRGSLQTS